ncbi:MAG: hypothetical protein IKD61_04140, partial [Oscillospiraceae bacterium]|nr:hypothetical protein [Oscillospiraceae bacterium]
MAVDKLVDSTQLDADLTSVANAIRTKGGTSASLAFPADFVSAIGDIPSGGISIDDLTTMSEPSGAIETSVSLVANYAFIRNPNITSFKDNTVERIGIEGFRYCTALQSVECANLTILGRPSSAITDTYTLGGCTSLESVKIPKCEHIYGGGILNGCGSSSHKITMALPAIKDAVGFRGSHFVVLDLGPDCPGFKNDATYQGSVTTLIMRRTSSLMTVGN